MWKEKKLAEDYKMVVSKAMVELIENEEEV